MYPHRIRLRGPWECELLARAIRHADGRVEMVKQGLPPPRRMIMPCRREESGLADFAGRVRFRRRFGLPRQLDPHETVWLCFAGLDGTALVTLNGRLLGRHEQASDPFEFEVTGTLQERNELVIDVEAPAGNGRLWDEVALEVRCAAFLRGICVWSEFGDATTKLRIQGQAVGTSDRPLELYVLVDGSTVAYRTIQPTAAGELFDLVHPESGPAAGDRSYGRGKEREVRIDLVNGAVIWYTVICRVEGAH
jgi:hypothetical protein